MTKLKDNGVYIVTATGDGDSPVVLDRTDEPIVLTGETELGMISFVGSPDGHTYSLEPPMRLHPTWLRPDMRPWPAPKRCTRRQRRLRGALKEWRRRVGAGVPHRFGFVAVAPNGSRCVV